MLRNHPVSHFLPCCPLFGCFCGAVVTAANRAALQCSAELLDTQTHPHEPQFGSDRTPGQDTLSTMNLATSVSSPILRFCER